MPDMTKAKFLFLIVITAVLCAGVSAQRKGRFVIGDLRFHQFESNIFGNKRQLRVLLPTGYKANRKQYPVLYLNDGQNLFDPRTSQSPQLEWGVDETVWSLYKSGLIEQMIVVGIDNAGKSERANEYLPWKDEFLEPPLEKPEGAKYPEFVKNEIVPFIEKNYRTKPGAKNRAIGGSSYGALISLYIVLKEPEFFGKLLLESPSFYVDQAMILKMSEDSKVWPAKIHLGVGTNEAGKKTCDPADESHEAVTDVRRLEKILDGKSEVHVVVETCAVHSEIAWGSRLAGALQFLFPAK